MKTTDWKAIMLSYISIIIGTTLLAISVNVFFDPNNLVTGGVTGLAIILSDVSEHAFGIPLSLSVLNLVLNVPLFLIAFKVLGVKYVWRTVFATVYLSVALEYTSFIPIYQGDMILSAVFGGAISGLGIGLVFRCMATTGGTDLLCSIIHHFNKHISLAVLLFILDSAVIVIGFFTFGFSPAMYSIIAVFIMSKVIDFVLEGFNFAKAVFIISDKNEQIAQSVMTAVERGATEINGRGMYTKSVKNVLLCVVNQKELPKVKKIIKELDSHAFVIVAEVREVLGEGFDVID